MPGDYTFGTAKAEVMDIQAGNVDVLLPCETDWQTFTKGQPFNVPANASDLPNYTNKGQALC